MNADYNRLSEIADIVDSLHKTPKYTGIGKPMVRVTDVQYGVLKLDNTSRVTDDVFEEFSRRYKPSLGDIIITRVGSYGITALVHDVNFCLGQNTSAIIPQKINSRYLYAALNSKQVKSQIESLVVGSTQKTLSLKAINDIKIPRFSPESENRIANISSGLDDKIELNCQINQTLEEIAHTLFKSWFVDFEPVKAKIEAKGNGQDPERAAMCAISGKSDAELDTLSPAQLVQLRSTADLFPDELVESEQGLIPKGWTVVSVGSEFALTMGQSPPGESYNKIGEGMPFYQGRADFESRFPKRRVYCTAPSRFAKAGDTLISVRAPVGDINMAAEDCSIGRGVAAARHKSGSRSYTYQFMRSLESSFASFEAEGTVFGSISKKDFQSIPCFASPPAIIDKFEHLLAPMDSQIEALSFESRSLTQLRDTLLPKLLSGEINVGNVHASIREVA